MTDAERDQIDSEAQSIIKTCRETIQRFREETGAQTVHPQVKDHRAAVLFLIDAYLKGHLHNTSKVVCFEDLIAC